LSLGSYNTESINHTSKGKRWPGGQKGLHYKRAKREQTFLSQRLADFVSRKSIIEILFKGQFIL
jgi:hypothetical protein